MTRLSQSIEESIVRGIAELTADGSPGYTMLARLNDAEVYPDRVTSADQRAAAASGYNRENFEQAGRELVDLVDKLVRVKFGGADPLDERFDFKRLESVNAERQAQRERREANPELYNIEPLKIGGLELGGRVGKIVDKIRLGVRQAATQQEAEDAEKMGEAIKGIAKETADAQIEQSRRRREAVVADSTLLINQQRSEANQTESFVKNLRAVVLGIDEQTTV